MNDWSRIDGPEPAPVWCGEELREYTGTYETCDGWIVTVRSDPVNNGRLALTAVLPGPRLVIKRDKLTGDDLDTFDPWTWWRAR